MAIIKSATLDAQRTVFSKIYKDAYEASQKESDHEKVATTVPSSSKSNTYGWLGAMPSVREWTGDRVLNDIKEHSYAITNKDWESTIAVDRNDIEDDNLGVYKPLLSSMGQSAATYADELVFALLKSGFSTNCFDGQFFFDTDHPIYPNHDGTGTAITISNMQDGSATPWFLLDTSKPLKPLIFQQRKKPVFTSMDSTTDESVFTNKTFRYGVDARSNVGFGFWQMAFGSKLDLTPANFDQARSAMRSIKADGGKPLNIKPTLLVVPPQLESAALRLIKAERDTSGATNIYQNSVDVLVTSWLA